MKGTFALFLHAHIPYCRMAGTWPAGEEWLFEAINETYLPLLRVLRSWQTDRVPTRATIGVVPVLAEQLADDYMRRRFDEYLRDLIRRAESDAHRFADDPARRALAEHWRERLVANHRAWHSEFYGDILGTLRWLQSEGVCEIATSAATHGLLPLFGRESAIRAQVRIGVETYRRHFSRDPRGFWLPECAYRPADSRDGRERRGIDEWLAAEGIEYTIVERAGLTGGRLLDDWHGDGAPRTARGYRLPSGVTAFGRDDSTGQQVWSPHIGYPGDPCYLDFHRKDADSGLRYWRVTDRHAGAKDLYHPAWAADRVASHAEHFVALVESRVRDAAAGGVNAPVVVAPYDCELFGHWWHEGPEFLDQVGRRLAGTGVVAGETIGAFTERERGSFAPVALGASTWGLNGDFTTWLNHDHGWVWPLIDDCARVTEELIEEIERRGGPPDDRGRRVLRQLARESLLMQGSDWPFLLFTEQAKAYANGRYHLHHQRLCRQISAARDLDDHSRLSDADLAEMSDADAAWPEIDYRAFGPVGQLTPA